MKAHLYGESALFVDLELEGIPGRAGRTLAAARVLAHRLPHADVVLGAGVVVVSGIGPWGAIDGVVAEAARAASDAPVDDDDGPLVDLPTLYDGPDLDSVAHAIGLGRAELIALHAGATYRAELLGFQPGFAYLAGVDPRLALPRHATPRVRVPAGSVAIAGGFTGVYPFASPGGWHLLGRTAATMFDASREPASLLAPGTRVRFTPVAELPVTPDRPAAPLPPPLRGLVIERAPPLATIQDGGRAGRLGQGLPPSGPLDPSAHVAANLAVGNPPGSAAIEVPLGSLEARARGDMVVSIDGAAAFAVRDGAPLVVPAARRAVRYLAVAGAVSTPRVQGAQATLVSAGIGGLSGRALRRGDMVPVAPAALGAPIRGPGTPDDPASPAVLFVDLGPHAERFPDGGIEALLAGDFRVSRRSDRVGVRLDGGAVPPPTPLALPVPMVRGAVEITPDGTPIVLGPDHPTTGGYPVIAVVRRVSQALLARCPPGHPVRFTLA